MSLNSIILIAATLFAVGIVGYFSWLEILKNKKIQDQKTSSLDIQDLKTKIEKEQLKKQLKEIREKREKLE